MWRVATPTRSTTEKLTDLNPHRHRRYGVRATKRPRVVQVSVPVEGFSLLVTQGRSSAWPQVQRQMLLMRSGNSRAEHKGD